MKYIVYIIIGILLFLVIKRIIGWVFPKLEISKNVISGILSIGLASIVSKALFVLFLNLIMYEYHPNRKFEVDSWQENLQDRHQMSEDLIESKILMNKTKEQLADKIGIPKSKSKLQQDSISNWRYSMGYRRWGFGSKFYYLNVEFSNGKSVEINVKEIID